MDGWKRKVADVLLVKKKKKRKEWITFDHFTKKESFFGQCKKRNTNVKYVYAENNLTLMYRYLI